MTLIASENFLSVELSKFRGSAGEGWIHLGEEGGQRSGRCGGSSAKTAETIAVVFVIRGGKSERCRGGNLIVGTGKIFRPYQMRFFRLGGLVEIPGFKIWAMLFLGGRNISKKRQRVLKNRPSWANLSNKWRNFRKFGENVVKLPKFGRVRVWEGEYGVEPKSRRKSWLCYTVQDGSLVEPS